MIYAAPTLEMKVCALIWTEDLTSRSEALIPEPRAINHHTSHKKLAAPHLSPHVEFLALYRRRLPWTKRRETECLLRRARTAGINRNTRKNVMMTKRSPSRNAHPANLSAQSVDPVLATLFASSVGRYSFLGSIWLH